MQTNNTIDESIQKKYDELKQFNIKTDNNAVIPKILHFNWVGDINKLPSYGYKTMQLMKEMNPDFEVRFTHITKQEIIDKLNSHDEYMTTIIRRAINRLKWRISVVEQSLLTDNVDTDRLFSNIFVVISNEIRFDALHTYGGIYCDLDCFPLKPFDEKLLSFNAFRMINRLNHQPDIFFMGSAKNVDLNDAKIFSCIPNSFDSKDNEDNQKFSNLYQKYIDLRLDLNDPLISDRDREKYIYHFECKDKHK